MTKKAQKHAKGDGKNANAYRESFEARQELYSLMKKVGGSTGCGYEEDDYTKTFYLEIGGGTLSYDPYYDQLSYIDSEECEHEVEENDSATMHGLIREIERRFETFEKETGLIRKKSPEKIIDKPLELWFEGDK